MKLYDSVREQVVIEFFEQAESENQVAINDSLPFLKSTLEKTGIDIPAYLQEAYGKQNNVKPGNVYFFKAFKEIYAPKYFSAQKYTWVP